MWGVPRCDRCGFECVSLSLLVARGKAVCGTWGQILGEGRWTVALSQAGDSPVGSWGWGGGWWLLWHHPKFWRVLLLVCSLGGGSYTQPDWPTRLWLQKGDKAGIGRLVSHLSQVSNSSCCTYTVLLLPVKAVVCHWSIICLIKCFKVQAGVFLWVQVGTPWGSLTWTHKGALFFELGTA